MAGRGGSRKCGHVSGELCQSGLQDLNLLAEIWELVGWLVVRRVVDHGAEEAACVSFTP